MLTDERIEELANKVLMETRELLGHPKYLNEHPEAMSAESADRVAEETARAFMKAVYLELFRVQRAEQLEKEKLKGSMGGG